MRERSSLKLICQIRARKLVRWVEKLRIQPLGVAHVAEFGHVRFGRRQRAVVQAQRVHQQGFGFGVARSQSLSVAYASPTSIRSALPVP